jgi:hypothetical protein
MLLRWYCCNSTLAGARHRRNATITHATKKFLDYFINRFLRFYQINATKIEKIVYYISFIRRTVTLLTEFVVRQPTCVAIKRVYKTLIIINNILCIKYR